MKTNKNRIWLHGVLLLSALITLTSCFSPEPEGLAKAGLATTTVKVDLFHRPLPEIPLPNDLATRYDVTSATGRRVNASMLAPTHFESRTRELIDGLDGWGTLQPITIPFTGPLSVQSILDGHRDLDYDLSNDVIYLIDIDEDSPDFGKPQYLDLGSGNYPVVLEDTDGYWKNDPRGWSLSLLFEEADEDLNGNGVLDAGEDTDTDGVLDKPNYLPGQNPARDDLAGRADALMGFYESETNTLIAKPLVPLRERTTYAVVVTKRLLDADGEPVGSPYPFISHTSQDQALKVLPNVLPAGLAMDDVAFAFSYTTQSVESSWSAVRDGLYGFGVQKHLAEEFPAELGGLFELRTKGSRFPNMNNPFLMWTENWLDAYQVVLQQFQGKKPDSYQYQLIVSSHQYIDYHVIGWVDSPQLFERYDESGDLLPLNAQAWPEDLTEKPAKARSERVYFHLSIPRKETSARGQGKPVPVVFMGHGYGGNRFSVLDLSALLAKYGVATIAIDAVSHGIDIGPDDKELVNLVLGGFGLEPASNALLTDRALDQNHDGVVDSGADFWTAYLFHTRDVVRQTALDNMQVIRVLRSFDGQRRWNFDFNGDGENELAGDFDGDGFIDVGGEAELSMTGGSLGGMMTMVIGALEPELQAIAPIIGGGGMGDLGLRSMQGGVREAFILRVMGPLFTGTLDPETGLTTLEMIIPELANSPSHLNFADVEGVKPGDTMITDNLANGERGCGTVSAEGTVRTSVACDVGDPIQVSFYGGDALVLGGDCLLKAGVTPYATINKFQKDVEFQEVMTEKDTQLKSLAEGLGLRRTNPEFRRFQGLGQLVLDPADPAVYARHLLKEPLFYPGTGQETGVHSLILTGTGDMSVPTSSGVLVGRAAGLIEYLKPDPRFGVSENQVLLNTYTVEGVNTLERYTDPDGVGVHMDVDNFSHGKDPWGDTVPRLDPPLRASFNEIDALGGRSAALFIYGDPKGKHGFPSPGEITEKAIRACQAACSAPPCDCLQPDVQDIGIFYLNLIGEYLAGGGRTLRDVPCIAQNNCPELPAPPAFRYDPDDPSLEEPPPPSPSCEFPDAVLGGTAELDALATSPSRCDAPSYHWLSPADLDLGAVLATGSEDSYMAFLLEQLAAGAGLPLPRTPAYDARVLQFSYQTQDRGVAAEASALVAIPEGYDGEEPMDMLLLMLPSQGLASQCALSNVTEQKMLAALFASFGYLVVAPDYLGTQGVGEPTGLVHPFLGAEPAALGALDALRAVGRLTEAQRDVCVAPRFAVLGASQGGQAAFFVERFAPYYAPELTFVGGAAASPPLDLSALSTEATTTLGAASESFALFLATVGPWYGLTDLSAVFTSPGDVDLPATIAASCDANLLGAYTSADELFTAELRAAAGTGDFSSLGSWACVVAESSVTSNSVNRIAVDAPIMVVAGESDTIVPAAATRGALATLCSSGMVLGYLECSGAAHDDAILWALPEMLDFIDARLAGDTVATSCQTSSPVSCQGTP